VCALSVAENKAIYHSAGCSDTNMEWLPNTNRWWPRVEMKQTIALSNTPTRKLLSAIRGYGLAIVSVAIALMAGLFLASLNFHDVEFPLFLFAIAITVWREGTGSGIFALILSSLAFNYFFTPPIHSLYITPAELHYYAVFILFALLITRFSAVRRRVERALRQSRDDLEKEVALRTQQASLLNLTHDTIFVRDLSDIITYWNHGAEDCTGGRQSRRSESDRMSFFRPFFRLVSTTLTRSYFGRDGGKASSGIQGRMKVKWWSRADGHCAAMRKSDLRVCWRRTTTLPSASTARKKSAVLTRNC
jgi:PAS domain-containing protein